MTEKIVVTGWGCLTGAGNSVDETWHAIKNGHSGIGKIDSWDTTEWEYQLGAALKNFDPRKSVDRKLLKLLSRHDVIGLNAVEQAINHSQLLSYRNSLADPTDFNEQTGVYVSSPGGKFNQQYDFFPLITQAEGNLQRFGADLNSVVHPMWLLRTLPNNVLAYTAIQYGFKGANQNIVNHSIGGSQAILEAKEALLRGDIQRAIVVGYDSMIEPQTHMYYSALGVVSKTDLKPFNEKRDGTILAEGSGALVLETLSSAKQRGAVIYGEIVGGYSATEAAGIFPIREDGLGLSNVLQETLQRIQWNEQQIGMITAHANGTVLSDAVEAQVFASLFSENSIPITGFKWALGHTFSAAGVIETIFTLLALKEGMVPGIRNLDQKARDCHALSVSQQDQSLEKNTALVVTRGFGSTTACIAISGAPK